MIRRHVLAALATGVEAGDDDAARAALASTDWVLRGVARRSFERALLDAALVSNAMVTAHDAEAMRHVLRVAALSIASAGGDDVDATDAARVTDAYAKLPPARPATAPIATIACACAATIAVALLVWSAIALRRPHHHVRGPTPMVAGAYLIGGTPARDVELEKLFTTELPSLVIQTDADRHSGRDARKPDVRLLRESPVIAAHGTALATAWREMIDALDRSVDVPLRSRRFHDAEAELRASTQAVSDQLAALGIGYHLEAEIMNDKVTASAAIFVFRVEDVVYVRAGGEPRRVLSLRRLDRLNITHTVLGMQTEELGDPVVLLDQIDDFVERRVLPIVGEGRDWLDGERVSVGAPFTIGDDNYFHTARGLELSRVASEAIHRELVPIFARGGDEAVRAAVVASVRRHEARHGFDNDLQATDDGLRYPAALVAHLGPADSKNARFVLRARAELSAYTSQIASDPAIPQLALWNLVNLGFNKERWGTAEAYVAVVVVEGLATRLGIATRGPVVHDGQLDRSRLAALAAPLAAIPDDRLRAAARELWLDLYGQPFMAIVDPDRVSATLGS